MEEVELLIKSEQGTDKKYGKSPKNRSIEELMGNSVILIDKHSGPTSHQVTAWVKKILNSKKAGHAGTLDPAVTGVLPIAIGEATKIMPVLMGIYKEYVGIMKIHSEVDESKIKKVMKEFVGVITQTPPVKSAVSRKPRKRTIHFFDLIEINEDRKNVLFHVGCEAGTYIRKLCHDVGVKLGTGAHMAELRRIKAGNFTEDQTNSLTDFKDAFEHWKKTGNETILRKMLIAPEYAIPHTKKVFVKDSAIDPICHGAPLYASGISKIQKGIIPGETIAVFSLKDELVTIGIARMASKDMLNKQKGSAIRTDRVLMPKGIYPKSKKR